MAASALRSKVSASVPSFGYKETPILAVKRKWSPVLTIKGCSNTWRNWFMATAASALLSIPEINATNSSPPIRDNTSWSPTWLRKRLASSTNISSPILWPKLSLICLNRSTSIITVANCKFSRFACRTSCLSCIMNFMRLGKCVSGSKYAKCVSCASFSFWAEISANTATK